MDLRLLAPLRDGCVRYRESLERELPNAPVADVEDK
jgi:hypothetical protein